MHVLDNISSLDFLTKTCSDHLAYVKEIKKYLNTHILRYLRNTGRNIMAERRERKTVSVAYFRVIFHGMLKNCRHSLKSEIDYAGCFEMRGGGGGGGKLMALLACSPTKAAIGFSLRDERGMDLHFLTRD